MLGTWEMGSIPKSSGADSGAFVKASGRLGAEALGERGGMISVKLTTMVGVSAVGHPGVAEVYDLGESK